MIAATIKTAGDFATEPVAWVAFDEAVERSRAFKLLREVEGEYVHPRIGTEDKDARIDRILIPLETAINAGWKDGAIGIEGKRSDAKVGPLISQALDYTRCAFRLAHSVLVLMLRWVFVFPLSSQDTLGDVGSIMANNRVGYASLSRGRIALGCVGMNALVIEPDGVISAARRLPMGGKRGSR